METKTIISSIKEIGFQVHDLKIGTSTFRLCYDSFHAYEQEQELKDIISNWVCPLIISDSNGGNLVGRTNIYFLHKHHCDVHSTLVKYEGADFDAFKQNFISRLKGGKRVPLDLTYLFCQDRWDDPRNDTSRKFHRYLAKVLADSEFSSDFGAMASQVFWRSISFDGFRGRFLADRGNVELGDYVCLCDSENSKRVLVWVRFFGQRSMLLLYLLYYSNYEVIPRECCFVDITGKKIFTGDKPKVTPRLKPLFDVHVAYFLLTGR